MCIRDSLTRETDGLGCAKLVVFCNAVEDNPFMAGAFHGVGEADSVVSVGVSGLSLIHIYYHYYGREIWEAAAAALLCGRNLLLAGSKATGKNVLAVIMIVRMGYAGPEPLGQRIPCAKMCIRDSCGMARRSSSSPLAKPFCTSAE